jgi:hypothetical protein
LDVSLVNLGIVEDFLNRLKGTTEKVLAKLLKMGTGERCVKVNTLKKGVNHDGSLGGG